MRPAAQLAIAAIATAWMVQACAPGPAPTTTLPLPEPAVSAYVKTEAAGFDVRDGSEIRYNMRYLLRREIGEDPSFLVEFENPLVGAKPLANGGRLEPSQTEIAVGSPLLPCIENHRNYHVELRLFAGRELVAQHKDLVQFSVPAHLLRGIDLNECAATRE